MPDPLTLAIAGAVAGKAAEVALVGGRKACESIAAIVKRRFAEEPAARAALESAERDPEENVERLATAIDYICSLDPKFDGELKHEWQRLQPTINAADNATVNSVSGNVEGSVIQVGRVGRDV